MPPGLDLRVQERYWGDKERGLAPPPSLLSWLIRNLQNAPATKDQSETALRRRKLYARDPDTISEALELLRARPSAKAWYILEGHTYPDAFLVTPDALFVIEGKRTEAGPTTSTTWMSVRHQMLRHMDAAWEIRGDRTVFGFFIVEEDPESSEVPSRWVSAAEDTVTWAAISESLPHRSPEEQAGIAAGFLGVTTWQAVCREFGLDPMVLPETTCPASIDSTVVPTPGASHH